MAQGNQLKPEYLSEDRLQEIKSQLAVLKGERRAEVARRLEYAKSLGDLSENAEYHEARDEQAWLEDEIIRLEDIVRRAIVVERKSNGEAHLGSIVTLRKYGASSDVDYSLVGSAEANLAQKKLSYESPLGKAIVGKKQGDTIAVATPNGDATYTIVSVS